MKGYDERELRWRLDRQPLPPLNTRSMSRFEIRLRGLAGSGGPNSTGYRWAERLCRLLERTLWR